MTVRQRVNTLFAVGCFPQAARGAGQVGDGGTLYRYGSMAGLFRGAVVVGIDPYLDGRNDNEKTMAFSLRDDRFVRLGDFLQLRW